MKRFRILLLTVFVLIVAATAAPAASRLNLVFFLVDDLGWRDVGAFGSNFYETPHVDRLAETGVRFTNGYAACPVCSPSRSSILTGKYPARTGITDYINPAGRNQPEQWRRNTRMLPARYADRLALEEVTLAETLKKAGYATFFAGKWHLGMKGFWPTDQGFDVNMGGYEAGGPYTGGKYFSPFKNPNLVDGPPGEHLPDRLARETVKFIEANRSGPFLAYLSFYSVHTPLMAREDLRKKYAAKARLLQFSGPRWITEHLREVRQVQDHAVYGGMVEAMDLAVGKVLDALDRLGLAGNTLVIFTSDNGGLSSSEGSPTSNSPLRGGKGWIYEGGIRVPVIVRAPGVTGGGVCTAPVISVDFFPTILELARLPPRPPAEVDGVSLVPLLEGDALQERPLFWHYPHYGNQGGAPSGAIREGDWKLVEWYENGRRELFNLRRDPGEHYNITAAHPEKVRQLHEQLKRWRVEAGARMPAPNPAFAIDQPEGR